MTVSQQKLNELIDEEETTAKYYHQMGWHTQARQEQSHANFFKRLKKKLYG